MFIEESHALLPDLQALRRRLHQCPELGNDLPETQALVLDALDGLGLEITRGRGSTSVTAVLRGGRPGPAVLLRGDMDALPLTETSGLDFAATNGRMHACGHDLHTAGLVGAARLLAAHRDELPGSVVFMFQPGEEGVGGAKIMLDEGVLDSAGERVVAAYGVHVFSGRPRGQFGLKGGPTLSAGNKLFVTLRGKGGHGSMPWLTIDPVAALTELAVSLNLFAARKFSPFDPVVLSVTQLRAGGEPVNVIPSEAFLGATIRAFSAESVEKLRVETERIARAVAEAHGCTAEVEFESYYPATINDEGEASFALAALRDAFGSERVLELPNPEMASEDFSFVLQQVPGAFFFLGATPQGFDPATAPANHAPQVIFDDEVLADQAAALAELAWKRLAN